VLSKSKQTSRVAGDHKGKGYKHQRIYLQKAFLKRDEGVRQGQGGIPPWHWVGACQVKDVSHLVSLMADKKKEISVRGKTRDRMGWDWPRLVQEGDVKSLKGRFFCVVFGPTVWEERSQQRRCILSLCNGSIWAHENVKILSKNENMTPGRRAGGEKKRRREADHINPERSIKHLRVNGFCRNWNVADVVLFTLHVVGEDEELACAGQTEFFQVGEEVNSQELVTSEPLFSFLGNRRKRQRRQAGGARKKSQSEVPWWTFFQSSDTCQGHISPHRPGKRCLWKFWLPFG
jgi:hypothetical protein